MRHLFLLVLLTILLIKNSFSQGNVFEAAWGTPGMEYAYQVEQLASGDYFFVSSLGYGKLNNILTLQWFQNNNLGSPKAFKITQDGNIAIISNQFSTKPRIFKINTSGQILWSYESQNNGTFSALDESANGDLVILYNTYVPPNSESGVFRLNASGTFLWNKTYNTNTNGAFNPTSIRATQDGGTIACGTQDYVPSNPNLVVFKCDAAGVLQWYKEYDSGNYESAESIIEVPGVGFACIGYANIYKILVCELDPAGNIIWSKNYGNTDYQIGSSVKLLGNGDFILTGVYRNWPSFNSSEGIILKLDGSGTFIWANRYGGNQSDSLSYISLTADNGFLACGSTISYGSGMRDLYFVKTDSNGFDGCQIAETLTTTNYPLTITSSNFSSTSSNLNTISLTPNPVLIQGYAFCFTSVEESEFNPFLNAFYNSAENALILNLDLLDKHGLDIYLFDETGRILYQRSLGSVSGTHKEKIDFQTFAEGIYIIQLSDGNQRYYKKILVIR